MLVDAFLGSKISSCTRRSQATKTKNISVDSNKCPLRPLLGIETHDYGTQTVTPELFDNDLEILLYVRVEGCEDVVLRRSCGKCHIIQY